MKGFRSNKHCSSRGGLTREQVGEIDMHDISKKICKIRNLGQGLHEIQGDLAICYDLSLRISHVLCL